MNCIELFSKQVEKHSDRVALWIPHRFGASHVTFRELQKLSGRAQSVLLEEGVRPGDCVLMLDPLGIRMYAWISALLAMGCCVMLVEPWMPVAKIQKVIRLAKPKFFLGNSLGFIWGARVREIRAIPNWIRTRRISRGSARAEMILQQVDPLTPGILTFTSGTTGDPKGVIRTQGYLLKQHEVLASHLGADQYSKPDLCIFANFVLCNLGSGRGSVVVKPSWAPSVLRDLDSLPSEIQPETMTAGPAFLLELMKYARVPSLRSIHIGGALTDTAIFEKAFSVWPDAHWSHIYGGSEVEPVATVDARVAVAQSKQRGFFQTLYLGKNVREIQPRIEPDNLWVSGPHVCPEYLGSDAENRLYKRKDEDGTLWHSMGDRIRADSDGWWYMGRSGQAIEDFNLEQRVYTQLQSSKSFIYRDPSGKRILFGENLTPQKSEILSTFPELDGINEAKIFRDRRHRARIDRQKSVRKGLQS